MARSGRVRSLRWAIGIDDSTDNHTMTIEISTQAVIQNTSHDTLGSLDEVKWYNNVGAAGTDHGAINVQRLMDYPVAAGERLYLNGVATISGTVTCFVDIQD